MGLQSFSSVASRYAPTMILGLLANGNASITSICPYRLSKPGGMTAVPGASWAQNERYVVEERTRGQVSFRCGIRGRGYLSTKWDWFLSALITVDDGISLRSWLQSLAQSSCSRGCEQFSGTIVIFATMLVLFNLSSRLQAMLVTSQIIVPDLPHPPCHHLPCSALHLVPAVSWPRRSTGSEISSQTN